MTSSTRRMLLAVTVLALLASCRSAPDSVAIPTDFDAQAARALELKQPLIVLVAEVAGSRANDNACEILESPPVKAASSKVVTVLLDVAISRNRATAARYHLVDTPLLVCLSSRGVIISRDEGPITQSLVLKRIEEAGHEGGALDAKLVSLEDAFGKEPGNPAAQSDLVDFLLAHHNAREAIAPLEAIAHSKTNTPALRVHAWVALVRAHFWIAEPEKGRHEAEDLIATLGDETPEARAGGELVLGIQDTNAKRTTLARQEFQAAIAAAPDSPYGKEAAEALAKLPTGVSR